MEPAQINKRVDKRLESIIDWLRAHKTQISQEESVEIVFNISGDHVKGKYTCFPKWSE